MAELTAWNSFFAVVGSAAGALIGLQFVVMTLIAQRPPARAREASFAFSSPTIVHFGVVLALAATLSAPWRTIAAPMALSGLVGLGGVTYAAIVARRMQTQTAYKPDLEDWLFHAILPIAVYAALAASAFAVYSNVREGMFGIGAAALMVLFIGIHNAWDATTWHVFVFIRNADRKSPEAPTNDDRRE